MKKALYPVLSVIIGVAILAYLVLSRQQPVEESHEIHGVLVNVLPVSRQSPTVRIFSHGTVMPRFEVSLSPQVNGKVVWTDPRLVAGGIFQENEEILRIEQVDYELQVKNAQAAVSRAEYDLAVMEGHAVIARDEWEIMQQSNRNLLMADRNPQQMPESPNPLVLYEPQMKNARANLESAQAQLTKSQLDLERTTLRAPFNCRIRKKIIDLGQVVGVGTPVAALFGTDVAEIEVTLPFEDLEWFDAARLGQVRGPEAEVTVEIRGRSYTWTGRVVRSVGEVDPMGRMARVVVQVRDPFNLRGVWPDEQPELPIGMFVDVAIIGKTIQNVMPVPRAALHPDDIVWVCNASNELELRTVAILRAEKETVFVSDGIAEGESIVLSSLVAPAPGLKLRPVAMENMQ